MVKIYFDYKDWNKWKKYMLTFNDIKEEFREIDIGGFITLVIAIFAWMIFLPFIFTNCIKLQVT